MTGTDEQLAARIAEITSLDYEEALAALNGDGALRELALSILESEDEYRHDLEQIDGAREKLRQAIPA